MIHIPQSRLDQWLSEDVPYLDLTTWLLGFGSRQGRISFCSRQEAVLCGSEEAGRILQELQLTVTRCTRSGTPIHPGEPLLEAEGSAEALHRGWKVCLNILEYASGIATRTRRLVELARQVNPRTEVVATRKNFPGTRELAIKGVLAGGGLPHRLGLSETVLIFQQHLDFLGGVAGLISCLPQLKARAYEKKVIVEVSDPRQAVELCQAGVDGIQFDKLPPAQLAAVVPLLKQLNPAPLVLAAGGIDESNIAGFARCGIDAAVTSTVYHGKPTDMRVTIKPL
jgi:molybdenum transport protein